MAVILDSEDLAAWLKGRSPKLARILAAPALGWALLEVEEGDAVLSY